MVHAEAVGSISYGKQPISRTKLEKKAYIFWYYRQINFDAIFNPKNASDIVYDCYK